MDAKEASTARQKLEAGSNRGSDDKTERRPSLLTLGPVSLEAFVREVAVAVPQPGTYYVVDLRRSTDETLWASSSDCGSWFGIPGAAIKTVEVIGTGCGGDPSCPVCCIAFKDGFAALSTTLSSFTLAGAASNGFVARPDVLRASPKAVPLDEAVVQETIWTLDHVRRGDCEMASGARFILRSDGTGSLVTRVKTNHTHSGDYWRQRFRVKNQPGAVLFVLPAGVGYYTGPRMDDDHGWYDWRIDFAYNQANYPYAYWLEYGDSSC